MTVPRDDAGKQSSIVNIPNVDAMLVGFTIIGGLSVAALF
jgi:hypothetical protein